MNSSKFLSMLVVIGLIANTAMICQAGEFPGSSPIGGVPFEDVSSLQALQASATTSKEAKVTLTAAALACRDRLAKTGATVTVLAKNHPYVSGGVVAIATICGIEHVIFSDGNVKKATKFAKTHPKATASTAVLGLTGLALATAQNNGNIKVQDWAKNGNIIVLGWARRVYDILPNLQLPSMPTLSSLSNWMPQITRKTLGGTVLVGGAAIGAQQAYSKGILDFLFPGSVAAQSVTVNASGSSAAAKKPAAKRPAAKTAAQSAVTVKASGSSVSASATALYRTPNSISRAIQSGQFENIEKSIDALNAASSVKTKLYSDLTAAKAKTA